MFDSTSDLEVPSYTKLSILNELGRMALSSSDLDELFRNAVRLLHDRLSLQYVMIGTFDFEKRAILTRATAGIDPALAAPQECQGMDEGIIGEVSRTGKTVVISDVSQAPRYLKVIPATRSEMCVPLTVAGSPVGFLNIESDRVGAFERADVEFFEAAGSFLGQAIRNAGLRQELEDSRNYLESVLQNAGDAILTFDLKGRVQTWNHSAERILGSALESVRRGTFLELVDGPKAGLEAAYQRVLAGEIVRNMLLSYTSESDSAARTLELSLAPVVASKGSMIGISCILRDVTEKILSEQKLQRNLAAMQLLNEISFELTSILELDKLLDKIAQIISRFIEYEFFAVLLIDEEREEFVWKTSVGFSDETLQELRHLSVHEGIVGRVARTRTPYLADDVTKESEYRPIRTRSGKEPRSELALPLIVKDKNIGVLVLGSEHKGYFRPHHLNQLTPLAAQIAVSIENASLYEGKSRDAMTQQVMNEIGKEITGILELDELLNHIAVLMRRVIEYEILGIFLYRPEKELMELKVAMGYAQETVERWRLIPLGTGLLGHAARERKTMISTDLPHDPRAISAKTSDGRWTQSEVAVPIISRGRVLGGLVVESCDPKRFKPEHVQILETLGSQMAVSIDNAQLFQQLLAKEQRLETDFALARDLQASMLPLAMPELKGIEIAAVYRPAESLGGDYYDFFWVDANILGLAIGDVSGKGVAAAITMAATRSALRFAARMNSSPSQVLYHVNRRLYRDVKKRTFVSLFYATLDVDTRRCRWSNGGHFPPLLLRSDKTRQELSEGGTLIALFDKSHYTAGQISLRPGDVICFYTDGVIEARNPDDEEFGMERLEKVLVKKASQTAKEKLRALTNELKKFTRGAEQHDDITAFILKVDEDA